jgi:cysteine desulfurase
MRAIYLDYAATTPMDERVVQAMLPYMTQQFGNPSSLHVFGREARQAVARARRQVAALLGAQPEEIFFTSGGSESDNWALRGLAAANRSRGRHIITTAVEHHAVLNTCRQMERQGWRVTYLPTDRAGQVSLTSLQAAMDEDTVLVSIMTANNEVGTLPPIADLAAYTRQHHVLFHTDAVQAVGHIPIAVEALSVDALSLSAHKLYGPKGIGVLYLRRGAAIEPLIAGGAQERDLRAGTENVPGIVGLGCAAALAGEELPLEMQRLRGLRDALQHGVEAIEGAWINGSLTDRLPGNLNFGIAGIDAESLLIQLDLAGFAVSAGSACSAGSLEPSAVLTAMGQRPDQAGSAIRVTLGRWTTQTDIDAFLAALGSIAAKRIK